MSDESKQDVDDFLDHMAEINPDALYPTNMKDAVIGYVERFGSPPVILMDRKKCIDILMAEGSSHEEAEEFFEFNTIGSWVGGARQLMPRSFAIYYKTGLSEESGIGHSQSGSSLSGDSSSDVPAQELSRIHTRMSR